MIRLLITSSLLLTAYAQQVSLEISNPTLANDPCSTDAECPGGSHVRCTTENNLWGDGSTAKCIAQSYETTNNVDYTSKDATHMLTQLADDGSESTCNSGAPESRDGDRCVTYKVWLQTSSADITQCTVTPTDATEKIQMDFEQGSTGSLVAETDFNGQKRYSCEFSPLNKLYIGNAEVTVAFKDTNSNNKNSLNLKLLVKPGADPQPADGNLLEMYANAGTGGTKHGISNAVVTADLRGNQFSYDLHLRDKRYKVKDDTGRRLLADRHAVSLATAEIEVLDAMKPLGTAWSLVAKYTDDTEAFIVMQAALQACDQGDALDFGEASDGPACPASGYGDYVLYNLKGAFAFKVDLPSFRKAYLKANCNSDLCPPKLTFTVGTLSTVVRDLVLPTLLDDSAFSISVDLIEPELKNERTTIKEHEPLINFYSLKKKPTVMSNLLNNANKDPIDLDDLQFNGNDVAACNAASMKVYEILAQSDKNKADKLYKNADDALKSPNCKAPAINLGNVDTLEWAAEDGTVTFNLATKSFIGDDGAVVTFDGIVVSHDRLSVIRATSVELDGSITTFLKVKSNPDEQYDFHSLESSVVDDNGNSITKAITLTTTEGPQFIHTAGCNGYVDIQLRRDGYAALKYDLRVPCERSTGKSVIGLTLKAEFASGYTLATNVWLSTAEYTGATQPEKVQFGVCVPGVDGMDDINTNDLAKTVGPCNQNLAKVADQTKYSNSMGVVDMKNCATAYNGDNDYTFETTIAMLQTADGFKHCSDRKFVTVINRDATATATSFSMADVDQDDVLTRAASVKNIEWVQCNNGDSLFRQQIDISVAHTVNGVAVAYDLTSIESLSNSDNLAMSIVTDNGVEIVRMESACVQVTYTECGDMDNENTPYGALAVTSTEFIVHGTYTGADGGNEHQTHITVDTNYQSCPVDGDESTLSLPDLTASISCAGATCDAEISADVNIDTAAVIAGADAASWQPETLDIYLVRKSLSGAVLRTDHVCDCDHVECTAQNNFYGFYRFACSVNNNGGDFDFESGPLSGYYGDSKFEVHFSMLVYNGPGNNRRLRTVNKMKASPGLEAEVDNIRVLPATMAAKLDSDPHPAPQAPKATTSEMTEWQWAGIIGGSIAGAIVVAAILLAMINRCCGGGGKGVAAVGFGGKPGGYREVGRAVRFKEISY